MHPNASPVVEFGIALLAVVMAALFAGGSWTGKKGGRWRAVIAVIFWLAMSAGLAASGLLANFAGRPPPLALLFGCAFGLAVALGFSRAGDRFAANFSLCVLIGAQSFRLPLEFVMRRAAHEGVMPAQMSFEGWNFDVVTGATAIVVAALEANRLAPCWLLWSWNVLGSATLLTIIVIAVSSFPMFHAFGTEPRRLNTWVAYFPFVWLPTVLVPAALFGHVVITRKLWQAGKPCQ